MTKQLENDLWSAADTLRANSDLKASEYSTPVLGLIFLKFADNKYRKHEPEILEVKTAESFFVHIHWLQERFPKAEYEDVTGLCKLATLEEVKEQDYSLNPGRYVGVVIEEDGKTEEEFIEDILSLNAELLELNKQATALESVVEHNVKQLTGE